MNQLNNNMRYCGDRWLAVHRGNVTGTKDPDMEFDGNLYNNNIVKVEQMSASNELLIYIKRLRRWLYSWISILFYAMV